MLETGEIPYILENGREDMVKKPISFFRMTPALMSNSTDVPAQRMNKATTTIRIISIGREEVKEFRR
ncbi:hypothetical protein ASE92_07625 [Pedobacter sp. Leaf41]|nr:hypothetical protein ASE92_07625 [Pedobacter sp. Leaf41]